MNLLCLDVGNYRGDITSAILLGERVIYLGGFPFSQENKTYAGNASIIIVREEKKLNFARNFFAICFEWAC